MTTTALLANLAGLAAIVTVAGLAMAIVANRFGAWEGVRFIPAIALIAIFISITHLPWPGPDWDGCGAPTTRPVVKPFRFIAAIERDWRGDLTFAEWVRQMMMSTTALNLHACIAIGAAIALCARKWWVPALTGLTMTALVETSQITGFFGIAPCPWRQFDVDDMILNASGVMIGFALARLAGVRPSSASPPRRHAMS